MALSARAINSFRLGHRLQHLVADRVASAVVDRLEVIQVDVKHRHHLMRACRQQQRVVEQRLHVALVFQPRQRIEERQPERPGFGVHQQLLHAMQDRRHWT